MTPEDKKRAIDEAREVLVGTPPKSLFVPTFSPVIHYSDGYKAAFSEAKGFDRDASPRGICHDAEFAALAAAEWKRLCSKRKDCQCHCTCMFCVLAHAWQRHFEELLRSLV